MSRNTPQHRYPPRPQQPQPFPYYEYAWSTVVLTNPRLRYVLPPPTEANRYDMVMATELLLHAPLR